MTVDDLEKTVNACLKNAEDFVTAADALAGKNIPQVRYHLATLALEEIGKARILSINFVSTTGVDSTFYTNIPFDDHVKKLFWAFFGPILTQEEPNRHTLDSYRGLAKKVHENRLRYLYIDPDDPSLPQDKVSEDEAENLVRMAELGLKMAPRPGDREIGESYLNNIRWFLVVTDDPVKRAIVWNEESFEKLKELGNVQKWIEWLKHRLEAEERQLQELMKNELSRGPIAEKEAKKAKWETTMHFYSVSHLMNQKAINKWNKQTTYAKLIKGPERNELICKFNLPKQVSLEDLSGAVMRMGRLIVGAFNIGTSGVFYWYLPNDIDGIYKVNDLENRVEVKLKHARVNMKADWKPVVLSEGEITRIQLVLVYWARIIGTDQESPLDSYMDGVAALAKNDLDMGFESYAFSQFWNCLKSAAEIHGHWSEGEDLKLAFRRFFGESAEIEKFEAFIELGNEIEAGTKKKEELTIHLALAMKWVCDAYFRKVALENLAASNDTSVSDSAGAVAG